MGVRVDVRALRALLDLIVPAKLPPGSLPTPAHGLRTPFQLSQEVLV